MQMLNAIFVSEIEIENLPPKLMRKYLTDILINIARTVYDFISPINPQHRSEARTFTLFNFAQIETNLSFFSSLAEEIEEIKFT